MKKMEEAKIRIEEIGTKAKERTKDVAGKAGRAAGRFFVWVAENPVSAMFLAAAAGITVNTGCQILETKKKLENMDLQNASINGRDGQITIIDDDDSRYFMDLSDVNDIEIKLK